MGQLLSYCTFGDMIQYDTKLYSILSHNCYLQKSTFSPNYVCKLKLCFDGYLNFLINVSIQSNTYFHQKQGILIPCILTLIHLSQPNSSQKYKKYKLLYDFKWRPKKRIFTSWKKKSWPKFEKPLFQKNFSMKSGSN